MKTYQNMNNEEIKEQLEWSDQHEFSYGYSMWAFKEIERLNNRIDKAIEYIEKSDDNENSYSDYDIEYHFKKELLDILKGSDKDEKNK